jgi:hypothetical protein
VCDVIIMVQSCIQSASSVQFSQSWLLSLLWSLFDFFTCVCVCVCVCVCARVCVRVHSLSLQKVPKQGRVCVHRDRSRRHRSVGRASRGGIRVLELVSIMARRTTQQQRPGTHPPRFSRPNHKAGITVLSVLGSVIKRFYTHRSTHIHVHLGVLCA